MAIKARCGSCGANFKAKDSLAGKRVKCPKCSAPIVINTPSGRSGATNGPSSGAAAASKKPAAYNPLLDLLDEADVKSAVRGPMCPSCSAQVRAGAIICVECGFNMETGERLRTSISENDDEEQGTADVGMTDTDRLMRKAEQDIDDSPVSAEGQDFGDGADSFVIAAVAGVILLVLVGIGLTVVLSMEWIVQFTNPGFISFLAAIGLWLTMGAWITMVAFMQKPGHGIACICTLGLWAVVYGFLQGKGLLLPTVFLLMAIVIGIGSGVYVSYFGMGPATDQAMGNRPVMVAAVSERM
jgi:hypothetical protein